MSKKPIAMPHMPRRLDVMLELTRLLETISVENGYNNNLKGSVFRGRSEYGEDSKEDLPFLSILEAPQPAFNQAADENKSYNKSTWELLIQGFVKDDKRNPTDAAYYLAADVERALSMIVAEDQMRGRPDHPEWYMLGNRITELVTLPPVVRPPLHGVSATSFFYMPIRLGLSYDLQKPYI